MPKKIERCIKDVKKNISSGKLKKTYKCAKGRCKTNPYAICKARQR